MNMLIQKYLNYIPYDLNISDKTIDYKSRIFCCIITSNKNLIFNSKNNLYIFDMKQYIK